jgi:hypothetical protein
MRNADTMLRVYEEVADRFARKGEPRHRDHCLVLAADAALAAGRPMEAERLRGRLLQFNPHHLLRPFASMAEALQAQDVKDYVGDLRNQWPPEFVEKLYLDGQGDQGEAEAPAPPRPKEKTVVPKVTEPAAPPPRAPQPVLSRPAPSPAPAPEPPPRPPAPPAAPPKKAPPLLVMPGPQHAPPSPFEPPTLPLPLADTSDRATPVGQWLASMLFLLGLLFAAALFFLTFVWPLLD